MQVDLVDNLLSAQASARAEKVLNACVHCGFCTATCPTYLLESNELDSPRGRIYLMKEMLERGEAGEITRTHLDRCLTCRSCETTCPSGVEYHTLLAIGRETVDQLVPRSFAQRFMRAAIRQLMLSPRLFGGLIRIGRVFAPLLPAYLRRVYFPALHSFPSPHSAAIPAQPVPAGSASKDVVLLLRGCVQPTLRPQTDRALEDVLSHCGVKVLAPAAAGCCGAVSTHTGAEEQGRALARANVDTWWPLREQHSVRAIVMSASGCGAQLKDYPALLADDPDYAERAMVLANLVRDPVEILEALIEEERFVPPMLASEPESVFHCPCTLQHGQQLHGRVERLLGRMGLALPAVADGHLCCGSAGTYSILQPERAKELRKRKLNALLDSEPDEILTANIGCQLHLQGGTEKPVRHWLERVADAVRDSDRRRP